MMRSGRWASLVLRMMVMGGIVSCEYIMRKEFVGWTKTSAGDICEEHQNTRRFYVHPTAGGADPSRLSGPDKYPWLTSALSLYGLSSTEFVHEQPRPRARSLQHSITSNGIVY